MVKKFEKLTGNELGGFSVTRTEEVITGSGGLEAGDVSKEIRETDLAVRMESNKVSLLDKFGQVAGTEIVNYWADYSERGATLDVSTAAYNAAEQGLELISGNSDYIESLDNTSDQAFDFLSTDNFHILMKIKFTTITPSNILIDTTTGTSGISFEFDDTGSAALTVNNNGDSLASSFFSWNAVPSVWYELQIVTDPDAGFVIFIVNGDVIEATPIQIPGAAQNLDSPLLFFGSSTDKLSGNVDALCRGIVISETTTQSDKIFNWIDGSNYE